MNYYVLTILYLILSDYCFSVSSKDPTSVIYNEPDIEAIAQEAGFNSKTTFNKSFKKIMGHSPSEYFSKSTE